jgi:hypothetical protein
MTSALWQKERKFPNMFNLKPQIAFHGTRLKSLPFIGKITTKKSDDLYPKNHLCSFVYSVHKGLVIPGSGNDVQVRSGSSLGVGIYLSPSADFSLQ